MQKKKKILFLIFVQINEMCVSEISKSKENVLIFFIEQMFFFFSMNSEKWLWVNRMCGGWSPCCNSGSHVGCHVSSGWTCHPVTLKLCFPQPPCLPLSQLLGKKQRGFRGSLFLLQLCCSFVKLFCTEDQSVTSSRNQTPHPMLEFWRL